MSKFLKKLAKAGWNKDKKKSNRAIRNQEYKEIKDQLEGDKGTIKPTNSPKKYKDKDHKKALNYLWHYKIYVRFERDKFEEGDWFSRTMTSSKSKLVKGREEMKNIVENKLVRNSILNELEFVLGLIKDLK